MMGTAIALTGAGCAAGWFLSARPPLCLKGRARLYCFALFCLANLWIFGVSILRIPQSSVYVQWVLLANTLAWMAVTDLHEQAVYDVHCAVLVLGGIVSAFFQLGGAFWTRTLAAAVIYVALWLSARKKNGLGMGDLRIIAALALYFPLSGWMESVLLSLLLTLISGVVYVMRRGGTWKTELPFMPFLLIGVLVEITAGSLP